jgi:hypothetical protein
MFWGGGYMDRRPCHRASLLIAVQEPAFVLGYGGQAVNLRYGHGMFP